MVRGWLLSQQRGRDARATGQDIHSGRALYGPVTGFFSASEAAKTREESLSPALSQRERGNNSLSPSGRVGKIVLLLDGEGANAMAQCVSPAIGRWLLKRSPYFFNRLLRHSQVRPLRRCADVGEQPSVWQLEQG